MNILREVRRSSQKSMPVRILLLLTFGVIFIVTTYAWFASDQDVLLKGLEGGVTSWDVAYYIEDDENNETEVLDKTAVFTIDELYPGMPDRTDVVHIYNIGTSSSVIQYELLSVKVFGQEVLSQLQTNGEIQTTGTTTQLFSKDTQYPFNISYTYDKTKLLGKYEDDTSTPNSFGTFMFNVEWDYQATGEQSVIDARDVLDTKFGKDAYAFYKDADNDPSKAIEVKVRITSTMVHPSQDPDHPDYGN